MARSDVLIILQLALSLTLAGALGWERELARRAAGLRTHMLVGLSATLFVGLGLALMSDVQESGIGAAGPIRIDPLHLIEAVVAGVSFLGAGTIFVSRGRGVQGLTTAASLLATAGVGVAVAMERYLVAIGTTMLVLIVLTVLRRLEPSAETKESPDRRGAAASRAR